MKILKALYWNQHVLLRPYTLGGENIQFMGSASTFTSCTLFLAWSVYGNIMKQLGDGDPLRNEYHMFEITTIASLTLSFAVIIKTKKSEDNSYVKMGFIGKKLAAFLSFVYLVGAFVLFFGFTL